MTKRRDSHCAPGVESALLLLLVMSLLSANAVSAAGTSLQRHLKIQADSPSPRLPQLPHPLYGVTIDSIEELRPTLEALGSLSQQPTARVVFDEYVPAGAYTAALRRIHAVSYVMGELVDSSAMSRYSVAQYADRAREYLSSVGSFVDIWEIGNEVNGEWSGDPADVVAKITQAFHIAKQHGARTALTLYYNEECWRYPWEEIFTWAEHRLSASLKNRLDYVLISYYEDDCNQLQPDWPVVFQRLGGMFPNSKLGFGEVGTIVNRHKHAYIQRYYGLRLDHPAFIGGYFWWHFVQDMVPRTKPLWRVLDTAISQGPAPVAEHGRRP